MIKPRWYYIFWPCVNLWWTLFFWYCRNFNWLLHRFWFSLYNITSSPGLIRYLVARKSLLFKIGFILFSGKISSILDFYWVDFVDYLWFYKIRTLWHWKSVLNISKASREPIWFVSLYSSCLKLICKGLDYSQSCDGIGEIISGNKPIFLGELSYELESLSLFSDNLWGIFWENRV